MKNLSLPPVLKGQWIWSNSFTNKEDLYVIARQEFELDDVGLDSLLYVTACSNYQLYINERLVGFGPRASHGDFTYVDCYEVKQFLQNGLNVIALVVYSSDDSRYSKELPSGIWCQLDIDEKPLLFSDRHWKITELTSSSNPRPRGAEKQLFVEYINCSSFPENWQNLKVDIDFNWSNLDVHIPINELGVELKIYPLTPPLIEESIGFEPYGYGRYEIGCAWTQINFGSRHRDRHFACAATSYIYSENGEILPMRLFSDDKFTFFCNRNKVISQSYSNGVEIIELKLEAGWNRILLLQNSGHNSMGFFMLFPTLAEVELPIRLEPELNSEKVWRIAGPLRVPIDYATTSINFDVLNSEIYDPKEHEILDMSAVFSEANYMELSCKKYPVVLKQGEFLRARLDKLRYGFLCVEVLANEGDIIDITIGYDLDKKEVPTRGAGRRATHTICCKKGINTVTLYRPREALYMLISVRKTLLGLKVINCGLEELVRENSTETQFSCSDEMLNKIWAIGCSTIRRSSAFIPMREEDSRFEVYLLDAYIESANMLVTYGDVEYSAARLRQFIDVQFSNGDIPALTFDGRYASQVNQLFFVPVWMLFNYRIGRDLTELKSLAEPLRNLWNFFLSIKSEESGLLEDIDSLYNLNESISNYFFKNKKRGIPTYSNALYCRFLLSVADVFRNLDMKELQKQALSEANKVAQKLQELNFDREKNLFVDNSFYENDTSSFSSECTIFANLAALLGGAMPKGSFESFFETFFDIESPFTFENGTRNPHFHFLFMELMFALGFGEWGISYLRQYWQERLNDDGSSWFSWDVKGSYKPIRFYNGSIVSPNIFLGREIAGLRYSEKEYGAIYFNPGLNNVDWAEVTVHNKSGKLHIRWDKLENNCLVVIIESNYPIKVFPELSKEQLDKTEFSHNSFVKILNPNF